MNFNTKLAAEKAVAFRALHKPGQPFILANAWDMGSARMLAAMGAQAIATSSAAHAFTLGKPDLGHVSRDEAIEHAKILNDATPLPLNGDLENGYGHSLIDVTATIHASGEAGLAGCGIEDMMLPEAKPYDFSTAVERIEAAVEAKSQLGRDFVLTARADGLMHGQYDLKEAIERIKAFEKAGADVLFIPMPADMDAVAEICRSVDAPVNVLCAGKFTRHTMKEFAEAGAARVSLGSALARITHRAILDAGRAMFDEGDMSMLGKSTGSNIIDPMLVAGSRDKD